MLSSSPGYLMWSLTIFFGIVGLLQLAYMRSKEAKRSKHKKGLPIPCSSHAEGANMHQNQGFQFSFVKTLKPSLASYYLRRHPAADMCIF
jgi:phosphatidylserine synthase